MASRNGLPRPAQWAVAIPRVKDSTALLNRPCWMSTSVDPGGWAMGGTRPLGGQGRKGDRSGSL